MLLCQGVVEATRSDYSLGRERNDMYTRPVIGQNEVPVFSSCVLMLVETVDSEHNSGRKAR